MIAMLVSTDGCAMSQSQKIRVLVVDDHPILRLGLAIFFATQDDLDMVGEAGDGQEAIDLCGQLQPDVVLMDLSLPVMDGITATSIITDHYPRTRVVVLTNTLAAERKRAALRAGASSYLEKNVSNDTLADAIRAAAA